VSLFAAVLKTYLPNAPRSEGDWDARDARIRAEREREAAELERQRIDRMVAKLLDQGAPGELLDKLLSRPPWPRFDESLLAVRALRDLRPGRSTVVLSGPTGTGKTMAALHFLLHQGGRNPWFIEAPAFMDAPPWDVSWQDATALVLDDLGTEDETRVKQFESFKNRLDAMVNRFTQGRPPFIVTTNLVPEKLFARYNSKRIQSRFVGVPGCWRTIEGKDMRGT
jgi:hypothetical protein